MSEQCMRTFFLKAFIFFNVIVFSPNLYAAPSVAPIEVFVSILPQKYMVERIGGDQVIVNVMVKPGQSPETFEPSPKMMSIYSRANIYFTIGLPFEQVWIERVASLNNAIKIVPTENVPTSEIAGIKPMSSHGHQHSMDPHSWLSPSLFLQQTNIVLQNLIDLSPDNKEFFFNNFKRLTNEVNVLDDKIKAAIKIRDKRRFLTFHPAFSIFPNNMVCFNWP